MQEETKPLEGSPSVDSAGSAESPESPQEPISAQDSSAEPNNKEIKEPKVKKPLSKHAKIAILIIITLFVCGTPFAVYAMLHKNTPEQTATSNDEQKGSDNKESKKLAGSKKLTRAVDFYSPPFVKFKDENGETKDYLAFTCKDTIEGEPCTVTAPEVVLDSDKITIIGYKPSDSHDDDPEFFYQPGEEIPLNSIENSFKIVASKKVTITYSYPRKNTTEQDSCEIRNDNWRKDKCKFTLPVYEQAGAFERTWSKEGDKTNTYISGETVEISNDTTFTAAYLHPRCGVNRNGQFCDTEYKQRDISVQRTVKVGNTTFDYETGIPKDIIDRHVSFINEAYKDQSWIFVPAKVFVLTKSTYERISIAYGLTYGLNYFNYIDIQYDPNFIESNVGGTPKGAISPNATIHELAHAWDNYYSYRTGNGEIHDQSDMQAFYSKLGSQKVLDLSIVEWFAGTSTEYYWHYLGKNPKEYSYAGYRDQLNDAEKAEFVQLYERYVNFAKNDYK